MRLTDLIEDPGQRWDVDKLDFDVLTDEELEQIVEITTVGIEYERDPENSRPMSRSEKIELNKICRKTANKGRRLML